MNYVIAEKKDLEGQSVNYQYAETLPDGRVILPSNVLRVITNLKVMIVDESTLKQMIKEQSEGTSPQPPKEESECPMTQIEDSATHIV